MLFLDLDAPRDDSPDEFFDFFLLELLGAAKPESRAGELRPRLDSGSRLDSVADRLGESIVDDDSPDPAELCRLECFALSERRLEGEPIGESLLVKLIRLSDIGGFTSLVPIVVAI